MLGYVRICKPEMKVKHYEAYRGIYCSLCKSLGKNYGIFSRMLLSYDLTFLAIIRLSLSGKQLNFKNGRCPFNPSKRCNYCQNGKDELDYAAAVTVLMFYYKVRDEISDGSFFRKILMYLILPYACLKRRKAKKLYSEVDSFIMKNMNEQSEIEKNATDSTDIAAHMSGDSLGKIFAFGLDDENKNIYRFGYAVGKWVYLADAADDIAKDLKKNNYNVFVNKHKLSSYDKKDKSVQSDISALLNMSCAMAVEAYDKIENKTLTEIIDNILFDGMNGAMERILKGTKKDERSL